VKAPYEWLLSKRPDTGLILRCCGVPAEWAGNEEMHGAVIDDLRRDWEQLGRPALILACPSCRKHLKEYLPEIETVTLYEVLDQWGGQWKLVQQGEAYSVFDPCSARHIEPLRQSVRNLAEQAGRRYRSC
jgi:Fe-S oxidoreductase